METRDQYHVDFYCPACGESSVINLVYPFIISPGGIWITCPKCTTRFDVRFEFIQQLTLDTQPKIVYNDRDADECVEPD